MAKQLYIKDGFRMKSIVLVFMLLMSTLIAQDEIFISVKGISDSKNNGTQKDRLEAIMDAKRQACEKAGLRIEAKTTVENFQTVYDFIESQAEAVLLPGFQIVDIGYVQDGTYQVVLSGKLKTENDSKDKEFASLVFMMETKRYKTIDRTEALQNFERFLNRTNLTLNEEAFQIYWGNIISVEKLKVDLYPYQYITIKFKVPPGLLEIDKIKNGGENFSVKKKMILSKMNYSIYIRDKYFDFDIGMPALYEDSTMYRLYDGRKYYDFYYPNDFIELDLD